MLEEMNQKAYFENREGQQAQAAKPRLERYDISSELWRQYEWTDPATGERVRYRIDRAKEVYLYKGCRTHRVVDQDGVAYCVPAVGMYGCVLLWKSKPGEAPVKF